MTIRSKIEQSENKVICKWWQLEVESEQNEHMMVVNDDN
jgi:hypothetical protein